LEVLNYATISTASGLSFVPRYEVTLNLDGEIEEHVIATEVILGDFDILIGMDIIGNGDFTVSTDPTKGICLSYRIPSMGKVDYVARANDS
jgi:hypothetical protein